MTGKARLLVAEDDADMRTLLRKVLSREGFEVTVASNGKEAVELLEAGGQFEIILTDMRMPEKDGLQVLREVRAARPEIKVIMITAYAELDQYLEVMKQGAFEYLTKPFKIPDLLAVLDRALGANGRRQPGGPPA